MPSPLEDLRRIRLEKLSKLKEKRVNPFPQITLPKRKKASELISLPLDQEFLTAGRLRSWRAHGGSTFADLYDESGKIQIFFGRDSLGEEVYQSLELLDLGDFISVQGTLFKTQAGELSLRVTSYELLTKSLRSLPSSFYGLKDVEERYRQRYVDLLVSPEVRKKFELRSRAIKFLRKRLDEEGFLEVETPVLQNQYGGATAKPFITHHQALNVDLFLRVSDELYLKRLIVGGFEKVYELSKDFRNEGIDKQHNPEFTMLEFYWAYQDYDGLMDFTENLVSQTVKDLTGSYKVNYQGRLVDFAPPWPRIRYREVLLENPGLSLDINKLTSESDLLKFIKDKKIDLDFAGVVGYAQILDTLYKKFVRPTLSGPLFLTDRPYQMVPLAKRKAEDESKSASFQLIVLGFELITAYNELNDPLDQRARWEEEMKLAGRGLAEYQVIDEDYLRALEYGMPPTAGWGLGIDRLVALLTDSHSLKEIILFPTLRPESDFVARHPEGPIAPKDLDASIRVPQHDEKKVEDGGDNNLPLEPGGDFPSRDKVFQIVSSHIKNQNLLRHCLAVEAAMRALAARLGGNQEAWGALGLIHDADWEETKSDPTRHTVAALEWLVGEGHKDGPVIQGLKSHNNRHTKLSELQSIMEWSLECCDELTGFIVSVTLVRPEKKLSAVTVDHVLKKWKEKSFAAAVDRTQITQCKEKLGIELNEFIQLTLDSMKLISADLVL